MSALPRLGPAALPGPVSSFNAWRIWMNRTGFDCSRSTFYRWLRTGQFPSHKIGGRVYVSWFELEEAVKQARGGNWPIRG